MLPVLIFLFPILKIANYFFRLKFSTTYLYHGHMSSEGTSFKNAPVNPETGRKTKSVFGLNPHFLR